MDKRKSRLALKAKQVIAFKLLSARRLVSEVFEMAGFNEEEFHQVFNALDTLREEMDFEFPKDETK